MGDDDTFEKFLNAENLRRDTISVAKISERIMNLTFMIKSAIELNNIERAKTLALDPLFIENNKDFVKSGLIISLCLEKGLNLFVQELINAGYLVKKDILLDATKAQNVLKIQNIITGRFYSPEGIELEY